MSEQHNNYQCVLSRYMPEEFIPLVVDLLITHPVQFKITRPRKTKLGDFRPDRNGKHVITVNGNLNPYAFLITTLHEFAHLIVHKKYGNSIKPHGNEWQIHYTELILPVLEKNTLPNTLQKALHNSLLNVKASSCTDKNLHRVLLTFDQMDDGLEILENIPKNTTFALEGRVFTKGKLRRTRFLCTENTTQRTYLVNALAKVKKIE